MDYIVRHFIPESAMPSGKSSTENRNDMEICVVRRWNSLRSTIAWSLETLPCLGESRNQSRCDFDRSLWPAESSTKSSGRRSEVMKFLRISINFHVSAFTACLRPYITIRRCVNWYRFGVSASYRDTWAMNLGKEGGRVLRRYLIFRIGLWFQRLFFRYFDYASNKCPIEQSVNCLFIWSVWSIHWSSPLPNSSIGIGLFRNRFWLNSVEGFSRSEIKPKEREMRSIGRISTDSSTFFWRSANKRWSKLTKCVAIVVEEDRPVSKRHFCCRSISLAFVHRVSHA